MPHQDVLSFSRCRQKADRLAVAGMVSSLVELHENGGAVGVDGQDEGEKD